MDCYVVAGEKSGDLIASQVLGNLPSRYRMRGVVGPMLKKGGVEEAFSIEALEVMGFIPVLKKLPKILLLFHQIKKEILRENPKVVLLVDNAEFSLWLARSLRKGGYRGRILQLISPSVWAWRKGRKKWLETYFDALLSIFPFEESFFADSPLPVYYIGHPLAEELSSYPPKNDLPSLSDKTVISLFPGSRRKEILLNFPLQLDAVKPFEEAFIAVGLSSLKWGKELEKLAQARGVKIHLIPPEHRFELMQKTTLALAKFGTVNLELALFEVPTITSFPLPLLERWVLQKIFKIFLPHYSIVNLLLERRLFPEYVASFATVENLSQEVKNHLRNPRLREHAIEGCKELKRILSQKHLGRAGEEILLHFLS